MTLFQLIILLGLISLVVRHFYKKGGAPPSNSHTKIRTNEKTEVGIEQPAPRAVETETQAHTKRLWAEFNSIYFNVTKERRREIYTIYLERHGSERRALEVAIDDWRKDNNKT